MAAEQKTVTLQSNYLTVLKPGRKIEAWKPEDNENVWELSGLYEGDIMLHPDGHGLSKNGLIDPETRWPGGIVPVFIHKEDFGALFFFVLSSSTSTHTRLLV